MIERMGVRNMWRLFRAISPQDDGDDGLGDTVAMAAGASEEVAMEYEMFVRSGGTLVAPMPSPADDSRG